MQDIQVDIGVKNEDGFFVVDGFVALPDVPTDLGTLNPGGVLLQQWELVPGELGITDPAGEVFLVQAQIIYTYTGQTFTTTTTPVPITVLPHSSWPGSVPSAVLSDKNATVGGPINTANGNYTYSQSTPGLPTVADPLRLEWTFNSLQVGAHPDFDPITTTLGAGWDPQLRFCDCRLGIYDWGMG